MATDGDKKLLDAIVKLDYDAASEAIQEHPNCVNAIHPNYETSALQQVLGPILFYGKTLREGDDAKGIRIATLLVKNGADVNYCMKDGTLARFDWKTPYQLTKQKTFQNKEDNDILQELITLMEEKGGDLKVVCPREGRVRMEPGGPRSGGSKKRKRKTKAKAKAKTKRKTKRKRKTKK
jgi:hypothetical protein